MSNAATVYLILLIMAIPCEIKSDLCSLLQYSSKTHISNIYNHTHIHIILTLFIAWQ